MLHDCKYVRFDFTLILFLWEEGHIINIEGQLSSNFGAFISYSHADSVVAKKLHNALETYRLPKSLRTLHGNDNGKIGPIFRDREDLPAGDDLSKSVKQALGQSSALIILCSPEARKSPWVAQEITLFRELHPDKPILAALIAGEPEQSFPKPLLEYGREPLAADLRAEGDGWKLGLLKLIAGIAQMSLDALIQRDAQRKLKRVTIITLLSGIAMIIMALMTAYAIQSRQEAQYQQEQAETLIIFMLRDLRNELKGASTLRVMTGVNQKALEYFTSQGDLSNLDDDSVSLVAETLRALGEDHEKRGDLEAALEPFAQAHRFTAEHLERDPANPDRIFDHAQSEYWMGYTAWQNNDYPKTETYWKNYLSLAQRLHTVEPHTIRALMELGYSNGNMCELSVAQEHDKESAISLCAKSIEYEKQAVEKDPNNIVNSMALANRHGWMADVLFRNKQYDAAYAHRNEEEVIISKLLIERPDDARLLFRKTWPQIGKAEIENARAKTQNAIIILEKVVEDLEELVKKMPENQHIIAIQIRTEMLLANIKRKTSINRWQSHQKTAESLYKTAATGDKGDPVRRMKNLVAIEE